VGAKEPSPHPSLSGGAEKIKHPSLTGGAYKICLPCEGEVERGHRKALPTPLPVRRG